MVVIVDIDGESVAVNVNLTDHNLSLQCPCGRGEISVGIDPIHEEQCSYCGSTYYAEYDTRVRFYKDGDLVDVL